MKFRKAFIFLILPLFLPLSPLFSEEELLSELESRVYHSITDGRYTYSGVSAGLVIHRFDGLQRIELKKVSCLPVKGGVTHLAMKGRTLIACAGPYGVLSIDVKDAEKPVVISRLDTSGSAMSSSITGDGLILIADGTMGALIARMEDDSNIKTISSIPSEDYTRSLAIKFPFVYIADGYAGIRFFDIRRPEEPQFIGKVIPSEGFEAREVTISGNLLACAGGSAGLWVMRIEEDGSLKVLTSIETEDIVRGVNFFKRYLLVANGVKGLDVVDIKRPEKAKVVANLDLNASIIRVSIYKDLSLLSADFRGLKIVSLKNPERPILVGE